jgi:tungstate transport system substrate-binding protein
MKKSDSKILIKSFLSIVLILVMIISPACTKKPKTITLGTTTSTQDSGLLDYLLPQFEKDTGIKVNVVAKGSGEAMELGKRGDVDCLLVHSPDAEEKFVSEGYGTGRTQLMYNDFVIVGPKGDPAKLSTSAPNDSVAAFKLINSSKSTFISRGDNSGTNAKENKLWKDAGVSPSGDWYVSAGKGMGDVLQMANEKKAYTLTDRSTYLTMKDRLDLNIVTEKDSKLYNQYSLIKLNTAKVKVKFPKEADEFIKWMVSEKGQRIIGEYGKDKYNQALFVPNAKL